VLGYLGQRGVELRRGRAVGHMLHNVAAQLSTSVEGLRLCRLDLCEHSLCCLLRACLL
jgi:hypothetical protein